MFLHNFKYTLKTLFKNKMLIFWTFAFPIILGTFFQMAFSDIEKSEKLDIIDIAIVDDGKTNTMIKEAFKQLSDEKSQDQLFHTSYVTETKAQSLLETGKISGYLLLGETPKIIVKENGINETILKYATEEILQMEEMINQIAEKEIKSLSQMEGEDLNSFYTSIYHKITTMYQENSSNIEDVSREHLSYTMIEFYTLIAMACLYGGILGMVAMNQHLANMSANGKRIVVSPTSHMKLVLSSAFASYIIQLLGITLLFLYTIFVLHVDYGNHIGYVILLALVGCFSGLTFGIAVSCLCKARENTKTGIVIALTMLGCFFSGMMGITMKYLIDKNLPFLNKINPASMITDGFYSLYYYDTFHRYYLNIGSLLLFSTFMILLSMHGLRRQKYDSI